MRTYIIDGVLFILVGAGGGGAWYYFSDPGSPTGELTLYDGTVDE